MDLVTLDENFHENRLVSGYGSLVWTERYSTAGDFQLISNRIADTIKALPLESYVSLRNSVVPMKVEAHKIEKKKGAAPQLTVVGRSFEATTLELRVAAKTIGHLRAAYSINAPKASDAAYKAMREVIGDTNRYLDGSEILPPQTPNNTNDGISEVDLVLPDDYWFELWSPTKVYAGGAHVRWPEATPPYTPHIYVATLSSGPTAGGGVAQDPNTSPGYWTLVTDTEAAAALITTTPYVVPPGNLYTSLLAMVGSNHHGIKATRPDASSNKVQIEIYNGADLTETVIFDAKFDQMDSATYLLSNTGSTNVAYVYAPESADLSIVVQKNAGDPPTGLNRRVMMMEVTDGLISPDALHSRGLTELYKHNATALFGGEVSQEVGEGFNRDYFLGDILKLKGEYGETYQDVRVAEFIRSSDSSGDKAYPTFQAIEPEE